MKPLLPLALLLAALAAAPLAFTLAARAQAGSGFGPLDPAPPAGHTVDEIVKRVGEQEAAFQKALNDYTFRRSVKMDGIDDNTGRVAGEYQQVTDITFTPDGKRDEHVVFAPQNTLDNAAGTFQGVMMSPTDVDEIEHRLPFILTTADLPQYDVKYLGRQKVDELQTYVFTAGPRAIEKNHHYFQGKVWVDQQDLEIVLVNGTTVPQDTRPGKEDLQPPFTTYYEQVDGKYWFPTYTKAEGILHFAPHDGALGEDAHLRSVVRYTDYKRFRATSRIIYDGQDITDKHTPDAQPPAPTPAPPKP
jgi:hypothetical protein